jgi:phage FluMu protein Com
MQLRCTTCHKPFALGKEEVNLALDTIHAEGLGHYNAYCPHCRRANRVSQQELQRAAPDWHPKPITEESSSS